MLLANVLLASAATLAVTEPCSYTVYKPLAARQLLEDRFLVSSGQLVRGEEIVARVGFSEDLAADEARLEVFDVDGRRLLLVSERVVSCGDIRVAYYPPGLCKEIAIIALRDQQGEGLPYHVISPNPYLVDHFVYGRKVGWGTFGDHLQDTFAWLEDYVVKTRNATSLEFATAMERFQFKLRTDRHVRDYLDLMTFSGEPGGPLTIEGIIPSTGIYDIIWNHAREAGFRGVKLDARIDGRYYQVDMRPRLYRCQG